MTEVVSYVSGRRGITPDDLAKFAEIVGYPVDYFLYLDYQLPRDFSLRQEVRRLSEQVTRLLEKVPEGRTDVQVLEYLRESLGLGDEAMQAIRQIIQEARMKLVEGD